MFFATAACRGITRVRRSAVGAVPVNRHARDYHNKAFDADDPLGEKCWDVHPAAAKFRDLDVDALIDAMDRQDVQNTHLSESSNRIFNLVRAAHKVSKDERKYRDAELSAAVAAATSGAGKADDTAAKEGGGDRKATTSGDDPAASEAHHLSHDELEQLKDDLRHKRREERQRFFAARSYATYEEFAAKELAGGADNEDDEDDEDDEEGDSEEGDEEEVVVAAKEGAATDTPAHLAAGVAVPQSLRPDAPRSAYEFHSTDPAAAAAASVNPVLHRTAAGMREVAEVENLGALRDSDDPLHWDTDDVIVWLKHFAPPETMDASMEDAFRMVRVNGDMLLNRVAVPVLFKEMRRWHIKQRKGELYDPAVSDQMVQEAVYMCYPYCKA